MSDYLHTLLTNPVILHSFHMAEPSENNTTPFFTLHNYLIRAFRTLFIILIPSKPLRLSTSIALILLPSYHCLATISKNRHQQ